jgi:hypothetical protein
VREDLLSRGTPNYIQIMMAFYTTTSAGQLRLRKLLKLEPGETAVTMIELNEMTGLIKSTADIAFFCDLISKLDFLKLEDIGCRAILAYIILFDGEIVKRSDEDLNDMVIMNKILYDHCRKAGQDQYDMDEFLSIAVTMSVFVASNIDWSDIVFPPNLLQSNVRSFNLIMGYTREEEAWLHNKFKQLEEAYRSVPGGQDLINVHIQFSQGLPIQLENSSRVAQIFNERVRRIFNIHSGKLLTKTFMLIQ